MIFALGSISVSVFGVAKFQGCVMWCSFCIFNSICITIVGRGMGVRSMAMMRGRTMSNWSGKNLAKGTCQSGGESKENLNEYKLH